jgi:deoxyribose-phosphate aldolase
VNATNNDLAIRDLAKMIDHPLLRPDLTNDELIEGLDLALLHNVASACIRSCDTDEARRRLEGSDVRVCVAIGFPHGSQTCETKLFETKLAMDSGADEIDVVINIGKWKSGDLAYVERELRSVIEEVTSRSGLTKVILETHYLNLEEIQMACQVIDRVGADFVANATGYAPRNVQLGDVELLRDSVSPEIGIKIAGGVNTLDQLLTYRFAGATRVGTLATEQILAQARDRFSA